MCSSDLQGYGGFGEVVNGDKIDESVQVNTLHCRFFLVMHELVELGLQAI